MVERLSCTTGQQKRRVRKACEHEALVDTACARGVGGEKAAKETNDKKTPEPASRLKISTSQIKNSPKRKGPGTPAALTLDRQHDFELNVDIAGAASNTTSGGANGAQAAATTTTTDTGKGTPGAAAAGGGQPRKRTGMSLKEYWKRAKSIHG